MAKKNKTTEGIAFDHHPFFIGQFPSADTH
jgi:hypothetical protein